MKIREYILGSMLSIVTGSLYYYLIAFLWGYIAVYNPLHDYILELARNGMPVAYRIVVHTQDFFINLVIMLPLAVIIYRLRPIGTWLYIFVALIACEATAMYPIWSDLKSYFETVSVYEYILFNFIITGPALIDYWLLRKKSQFPPNKKRNELEAIEVAPVR